ncbi:hypothetical protein RMQ97_01970 [Maricaulis sp. D1M11]|uniref:hypothetical protein n=1 Tax=Maricaulis sp. D1M11 TaxID=3076117 RepID=UPI0039B6CF77
MIRWFAIAMVFLLTSACATQSETRSSDTVGTEESPTFQTSFRQALIQAQSKHYGMAQAFAETALALAESDMQNYQVRHLLVDVHGRQGHWDVVAQFAGEAAAIIRSSPNLSSRLMVMASHMEAERARAAYQMGQTQIVQASNAQMIEDHPDAGELWQPVGVDGAEHEAGLSCPLLRQGYLRFDVYDGNFEAPGCEYWGHNDVGARVFLGDVVASEEDQLVARSATDMPVNIDLGDTLNISSQWQVRSGVTAFVATNADSSITLTLQFPDGQRDAAEQFARELAVSD